MIHITLPVPPSTNNRTVGLGSYKGYAARKQVGKYQDRVRTQIMAEKRKPLDGPLGALIVWYRARRVGDLIDRWKDMMDGMEAKVKRRGKNPVHNFGFGAYYDDKQISFSTLLRSDREPHQARVEVHIWRIFDRKDWDEYFSMLPHLLADVEDRKMEKILSTKIRGV